jgi:hypothetical protein
MKTNYCQKFSEASIKMDIRQVDCLSVDWIEVAQDVVQWRKILNSDMNIQFSFNTRFLHQANSCQSVKGRPFIMELVS